MLWPYQHACNFSSAQIVVNMSVLGARIRPLRVGAGSFACDEQRFSHPLKRSLGPVALKRSVAALKKSFGDSQLKKSDGDAPLKSFGAAPLQRSSRVLGVVPASNAKRPCLSGTLPQGSPKTGALPTPSSSSKVAGMCSETPSASSTSSLKRRSGVLGVLASCQ